MIVNFIIPGDINLPTGGYRYDKRILQEWEIASLQCNLISLEGNFPFPSKTSVEAAISAAANFPKADMSVVDGLAGGAMPRFLKVLSKSSPVIALIHHPLGLENGLSETEATTLIEAEKDGLQYVTAVVTTSQTTTDTVSELFSFPMEKIATVEPGVERGQLSKPHSSGALRMLCIGSLVERKGHRFLIEALSGLGGYDWTLDCYGMMDKHSDLYHQISVLIERFDLNEKITLHGTASDEQIEQAYAKANLFVLPSLYEGYGMAYAEAIVRGLPVVGTHAGAIPRTVPEGCGLLVEPGNSNDLRKALEQLLNNREELNRLRLGALAAADGFPTWRSSAEKFKQIMEQWI